MNQLVCILIFLSLSVYSESKNIKRVIESISKKANSPNLSLASNHLLGSSKNFPPKKKEKPIEATKKNNPISAEIVNFERIFESKDFTLKARARSFKQGEIMMIRLFDPNGNTSSDNLKKYFIKWQNKTIKLYSINQILTAFIPIHPEMKEGVYDLEVRSSDEEKTYKVCPIEILKTFYIESKSTESLKLPKKFAPSKIDNTDYSFIIECEKIKKAAFETISDINFANNFQLPAKIKKITSNFYARRNYFKKRGKPHGGIDIRGNTGDPIYSIQDGKVLISRPMHFEGIFTVVDHGGKIFSLYMHQSETLVKEGDSVKKGQQIGKIGSTGMSTGPHLHLGLKVDNVLINPLSFVHLKIF